VIVTLLSQLSVAVAVPGFTIAEHESGSAEVVIFDGQLVIVGAVVSTTLRLKLRVDELPAPPLLLEPSFAEIEIAWVPSPTTVPGAGD
jgi:hypothetical protein